MRIIVAALLTLPLLAAAETFPKADPVAGKKLADAANCARCHSARFGGDGSAIYTRADHRVKTPGQLLAQVQMCNTQLNTGWFPEEEQHVAVYLNRDYYKFK